LHESVLHESILHESVTHIIGSGSVVPGPTLPVVSIVIHVVSVQQSVYDLLLFLELLGELWQLHWLHD